MTTQPMTVPGKGHSPADSIPDQLRATARRRQERASLLRAWSREANPVLDLSLARRAAELELGAVALELRADGLDGTDGGDQQLVGVGVEGGR